MLLLMITAANDAGQADWLSRSAAHMYTVHVMVPDVFEAYARVFHPAARHEGPPPRVGEFVNAAAEREVRWAEVASANDRTMHGAAEWGQLTGSWSLEAQAGLWDREPECGRTPERLGLRLAAILGTHTSTPDRCWFGVWEGWGNGATGALHLFTEGTPEAEQARLIEEWEEEQERLAAWGRHVRGAPVFRVPSRGYHLLHGPLSELDRFYAPGADPPSIWWPEDRAWCVGGDVDLMTTYVGASAAAIEAVVSDEELEALTIPAGQSVTWEADTLNPSVGPPS
jgi:hypothetical protein